MSKATHNGIPPSAPVVGCGQDPSRGPRERIQWTSELNKGLVHCYKGSDPNRRGYMARMHDLWRERHTEYGHLSQQHLRDQVVSLKNREPELFQEQQTSAQEEMQAEAVQPAPGDAPVREMDPELRALFLDTVRATKDTAMWDREKIPSTCKATNEKIRQMSAVLEEYCQISIPSLWELNCAVYSAATILSGGARHPRKEDKLQQRVDKLDAKILHCRQMASRLDCVIKWLEKGGIPSTKVRRTAEMVRRQHHSLNKNTLGVVKATYVAKVASLSLARRKVLRKKRWVEENALFASNPSKFMDKRKKEQVRDPPTAEETTTFWKEIYETAPHFDESVPWLQEFRKYCHRKIPEPKEDPVIDRATISSVLKVRKNRSAPGPDGIISYWWKVFPFLADHLCHHFSQLLKGDADTPSWLVEGRTVLIPKGGDLSSPKNYRPITCLNTLYKIFTGVIYELLLKAISPVWEDTYEQRGSKRSMAGTKECLLVDRSVCTDSVYHKRNLSMAWLDYRKAFDTTSHAYLLVLLKCLRVHPQMQRCIGDLLPLWKTRFVISSGKRSSTTEPVIYRRGVFQGDSLSPLLFCISLLPISQQLRAGPGYSAGPPSRREHKVTHLFYMDDLKIFAASEKAVHQALEKVRAFSRNIGMEFGLDKCAVLHLKKGRLPAETGAGVELSDGGIIQDLGPTNTYKYLGVPEGQGLNEWTAKTQLQSEYKRRLRRIWSSELSAVNKVRATQMFGLSVLQYSFGVLKWTRDELRVLDRTTRKIMNMHRSLHPQSSVDRLYMPRDQGGRGLASVEQMHDRVVLGMACRVLQGTDPLLRFVAAHERAGLGAILFKQAGTSARDLGIVLDIGAKAAIDGKPVAEIGLRALSGRIRRLQQVRALETHRAKPIHGQFFATLDKQGLNKEHTWAWLRSGGLRSETEGFLMAAQDGVLPLMNRRKVVLGENVDAKCRACKKAPETTYHLLSACSSYAPTKYVSRHNAALRVLYFHLRHSYRIDEEPVVPYVPADLPSVVENDNCRIYWNFPVPTTRQLEATKPDIVLFDWSRKEIHFVEFSCPAETNMAVKEDEKSAKYRDLAFDIGKQYPGHKVIITVLLIAVMGGMNGSFLTRLADLPTCRERAVVLAAQMQKAVLLGSLSLIRSHLGTA